MSATGALLLVLFALLVLGCLAAWLLNVPWWAVSISAAVGGLVLYRLYRRLARGRARQDTEA